MIRFAWVCLLLFLVNPAIAQIIIVPQTETEGVIPKQQVFMLMINNVGRNAVRVSIEIQVTDMGRGEIVSSLITAPLDIQVGANRFSYREISSLTAVNGSSAIMSISGSESIFPAGKFRVCYRVFNPESKGDILSAECVMLNSYPLSPIQLIIPDNGVSITETRPQFAWTPPSPVTMFKQLNYRIQIKRQFDGQSPEDAIRKNTPLLEYVTSSPALGYPASYSNLETGNKYVWQVTALDGNVATSFSSAWYFKILPDSVQKLIELSPFIKLSKENSEVTIVHEGHLKLEYYNYLSDSSVTIQIKNVNDKTNDRKQSLTFNVSVKHGQNLLKYSIGSKMKLDENAVYQVVLTNGQKEMWVTRFKPKFY